MSDWKSGRDAVDRAFDKSLSAALERARTYKMTPQEVFEQRVSFVSEGRNKDEVRRQMIEAQGYPAEATERPQIVAWLRAEAEKRRSIADHEGGFELHWAADRIEAGAGHIAGDQ